MNTRIDITLSPETVERIRRASFEKYKNMRSTSKLIEELILEGLGAGNIEAIQAEREEWIAEITKETVELMKRKGGSICRNPLHWICGNCGAEFEVTIRSDAKYCPVCRSDRIRVLAEEEKTIWQRIYEVAISERKIS